MPTFDLVADGSGVGDGQRETPNVSITSGTNVLTINSGTGPTAGDEGKTILIYGAAVGSRSDNALLTTISSISGSDITLANNATTTISAAATEILWGTDNTAAFTAFNDWGILQSGLVELTIPAGMFCTRMDNTRRPLKGIAQVKLTGAGKSSTLISQLLAGQLYFGGSDPVAHFGLNSVNGNSARLVTLLRGSTAFQVSNPSFYSKFAVNRHILITAYDLQGIWQSNFGYPPNPFFYERNYLTAYDSETGAGTLATPAKYPYKSTYPTWQLGNEFEADACGKATAYMPDTSYDTEIELTDFTIDNPYFQSVAHGRQVVLRRVSCSGGSGIYPTQNDVFEAYSCDWPDADLEVDKINGTVLFDTCLFNILRFQSGSPDLCTMTNCTLNQRIGAPKKLVETGSTYTGSKVFSSGATGFGRTDEIIMTNCSGLDTFTQTSASHSGIHGGGVSATMPMSGGIITMANADNDAAGGQENPTRIFVPGTWLVADNKLIFRVLDVTQDETNTYIHTSLSGDWPFTVTSLGVHPAPRITMRGCTGTAPILEDLNQAQAGRPLYSYSKRTYVANGSGTTAKAKPFLLGQLVTAKYNVTDNYEAGALTFNQSQFDNWTVYLSDYSTLSIDSAINMTIVGERTLVGGGAPIGAQSGDDLDDHTANGNLWFAGVSNSGPNFSANIAGETPTITVEIITNQGIVPSFVAPLGLRLQSF